jgi:hypothetical protein
LKISASHRISSHERSIERLCVEGHRIPAHFVAELRGSSKDPAIGADSRWPSLQAHLAALRRVAQIPACADGLAPPTLPYKLDFFSSLYYS